RALLDRVPAQLAVLGVDPGTQRLAALLARRPARDPELGPGLAAGQEVVVLLVGDHGPMHRLVESRAADVAAADVPVVMEEHPAHFEGLVGGDRERPEEPVLGQVDVISVGYGVAQDVVEKVARRVMAYDLVAVLPE